MNSFFRKSECLGSWLHRFEIVEEFEDGILEACEICKIKKFFKIVEGRPDNQEYMNFHIRNALPPNHPYYFHEFLFNPLNEDEIESPYV